MDSTKNHRKVHKNVLEMALSIVGFCPQLGPPLPSIPVAILDFRTSIVIGFQLIRNVVRGNGEGTFRVRNKVV